MSTTLYRSLALLISMFALTASFSLSSNNESDDKRSWFLEYGCSLDKVYRWKDNDLQLGSYDNDFKEIVKSFLADEIELEEEELHASFRIYKHVEEEQIIGLILKATKDNATEGILKLCHYCNKKLNLLDTDYAKMIAKRKVNLTDCILKLISSEENAYVFRIDWKEPDEDFEDMKVFFEDKNRGLFRYLTTSSLKKTKKIPKNLKTRKKTTQKIKKAT